MNVLSSLAVRNLLPVVINVVPSLNHWKYIDSYVSQLSIASCPHVGYLSARFEYFQDRFAHKAVQDRTRRALSDGLFTFFPRPFHHRENPKKLQKKWKKDALFSKKLSRFAHKAIQSGPKMDSDITMGCKAISIYGRLKKNFHMMMRMQ